MPCWQSNTRMRNIGQIYDLLSKATAVLFFQPKKCISNLCTTFGAASTWHWWESAPSLIFQANGSSMLDLHCCSEEHNISHVCGFKQIMLVPDRNHQLKMVCRPTRILRLSWSWVILQIFDNSSYLSSNWHTTLLGTATFYSFILAGAPHTRLDVSLTRSLV